MAFDHAVAPRPIATSFISGAQLPVDGGWLTR